MKSEDMFLKYARENHLKGEQLEYTSWHFGYDQKLADELAHLVITGEKTATTSSHWLYEVEEEELPKVGNLSVVETFNGKAVCIIKTVKVDIVRFCDVTAEFAAKEGEGDKSLAYWKEAHKAVFTAELEAEGKTFDEKMLVVCEEFEVVS